MTSLPSAAQGHGTAAHGEDCVIEAWGPDRLSCLAEAMQALVDVFAEAKDRTAARTVPIWVDPVSDLEVLVTLLEDVIYVTDVLGIPVRFHLAGAEGGAVCGYMEVVDASDVEQVGPVPKAVSYHGIEFAEHDGTWRCRVLIDV